jgi:hypothetical protein
LRVENGAYLIVPVAAIQEIVAVEALDAIAAAQAEELVIVRSATQELAGTHPIPDRQSRPPHVR